MPLFGQRTRVTGLPTAFGRLARMLGQGLQQQEIIMGQLEDLGTKLDALQKAVDDLKGRTVEPDLGPAMAKVDSLTTEIETLAQPSPPAAPPA